MPLLFCKIFRVNVVGWLFNVNSVPSSVFVSCYDLLGGLAEEVDKELLKAAFIPFGDIIDINMPLDYQTGEKNASCLKFPPFLPQKNIEGLHLSSTKRLRMPLLQLTIW